MKLELQSCSLTALAPNLVKPSMPSSAATPLQLQLQALNGRSSAADWHVSIRVSRLCGETALPWNLTTNYIRAAKSLSNPTRFSFQVCPATDPTHVKTRIPKCIVTAGCMRLYDFRKIASVVRGAQDGPRRRLIKVGPWSFQSLGFWISFRVIKTRCPPSAFGHQKLPGLYRFRRKRRASLPNLKDLKVSFQASKACFQQNRLMRVALVGGARSMPQDECACQFFVASDFFQRSHIRFGISVSCSW